MKSKIAFRPIFLMLLVSTVGSLGRGSDETLKSTFLVETAVNVMQPQNISLLSENLPYYNASLRSVMGLNELPDALYLRIKRQNGDTEYRQFENPEDLNIWCAGNNDICKVERLPALKPLLDHSVADIRADDLHNGQLGFPVTGHGVWVGIVDSGIDWRHPDFIDRDGNSRIVGIWDQTDGSGEPPDGFHYGSYYSNEQIQAAIDGTGPNVGGQDIWGHGTHVAGIAAGNGGEYGQYKGIAPEAGILVVKSGDGQFYEHLIVDGLKFCYNAAEQADVPIAVNLSVGGTHKGPHDSSSPFEAAIDSLLDPFVYTGRGLAIAAGNDGDRLIHFSGTASSNQSFDVKFDVQSNSPGLLDFIAFEIWSDSYSSQLTVSVVTPGGTAIGPVAMEQSATMHTEEGSVYIDHGVEGYLSEQEAFRSELRISDASDNGQVNDNLAIGSWQIRLQGPPSHFDGWIYDSSFNAEFNQNGDSDLTVSEPGHARFAMTVGSYSTRSDWPMLSGELWSPYDITVGSLSTFSSRGGGRQLNLAKPDLCAPGEYVCSSHGQSVAFPPTDQYLTPDGLHRAWSGTSMAAPHVTGVTALMFQVNPQLNSLELQSVLTNTARLDAFTHQSGWDSRWGRGKLDAFAALELTGVEDELLPEGFNKDLALQIFPNPVTSKSRMIFSLKKPGLVIISVYNSLGQRISRWEYGMFSSGSHTVNWPGQDNYGTPMPSGLYFVELQTETCSISEKVLIIH